MKQLKKESKKLKNYSIVIPIHNEERGLIKTLDHLKKLEYPKENYEVILVENGSSDNSYKICKKYQSKYFKLYSLKTPGVSRARNLGAEKASKKTDWIVFLDADVLLKPTFLLELDSYLKRNISKNLSIGTTKLLPIEKNLNTRLWFLYYDLVHKYLRMSASIQIANKKFFGKVIYDENLNFSEDLKFIKDMTRYGKFFYIPTESVFASARRFEQVGGLKLSLKWMYEGSIPYKWKIKKPYKVMR